MNRAPSFIADRIRFQGRIAAAATAVSAFVIVAAACVSAGFRHTLGGAISQTVVSCGGAPVPFDNPDLKRRMLSPDGVESVKGSVILQCILRSDGDIEGMFVRSDPSLEGLEVAVPSSVRRTLGLRDGDRVQAFFPSDKPKARVLEVVSGTGDDIELDCTPVARASEEALRRIAGLSEGEFNSIVVSTDGSVRSSAQMRSLCAALSAVIPGSTAVGLADGAEGTFDWLQMIDANVLAILALMTLVAAFNMISGLLILVMRHRSTIGTLKALGMGDRAVSGVFLRVSARASGIGLLSGGAAALLLCTVQSRTHFLKLDPVNYFLPYVPVQADFGAIIPALVAVWAVITLLVALPCRLISRIDPSLSIQNE